MSFPLGNKRAVSSAVGHDSTQCVREGREMVRREGHNALDSIEILHQAEVETVGPTGTHIQAHGSVVLQHRDALDIQLGALGHNVAQHLHDLARGRLDLIWGVGLFFLNGILAVFVFLAFGPQWVALLLALLVLASALPVEEFFQAVDEQVALRAGIFLALSIIAIAAQIWLGCVRGMLLGAVAADGTGPITDALAKGGAIVRYALGMLAAVTEVICGWKLHRARTALLSPKARAARERDRLNNELTLLSGALHANSAGPEIRRHYRRVGARQELAWNASAPERARATHLKRALKGAFIGLAIFALLFFLASRLSAEPNADHGVAVLIDLSKSTPPVSFKANLDGVSKVIGKLQPNDHLIVLGITDTFSNPAILLDKSMPRDAGFLDLQQRAAREAILSTWRNTSTNLMPVYLHTDLFGALTLIPYLNLGTGIRIVMFSDLQQSMKDLDFEKLEIIPSEHVLNVLKKANAIPSLDGASIFALGVDPAGKNAAAFASRRDFWLKFFTAAHAEVKVFSIDHHVPDLLVEQQR